MKKFRGVVVGAGYFSSFHYEAWRRIPEVDLVAFSELDKARAQSITDTFGLARCYTDYREMSTRRNRISWT